DSHTPQLISFPTRRSSDLIDPTLYDKIARGAQPIKERPGALVPPALRRIRETRGPFASDDDVLLTAFYDGAKGPRVSLILLSARSEEHTSELQSRSDIVCR